VNIPEVVLREAERKCNVLSEIKEDFQHVIDDLEQRYGAMIHVQIIRPVIGGGAGPVRIILSQIERFDG
jgi:hypothetical protein